MRSTSSRLVFDFIGLGEISERCVEDAVDAVTEIMEIRQADKPFVGSLRVDQFAGSAAKAKSGRRVVKRHIMEGRRHCVLAHVVHEPVAISKVVQQQIKDMPVALPVAGNGGKRNPALRDEVLKSVHVPVEDAAANGIDLLDLLQLGIEESGNEFAG